MSISSLSFNASTRATIMRLQNELKDATTEQGTGRFADVGATLGRLSGEAVQYHSQESTIKRMQDSNKLVTNRLEVMDDVLTNLRDTAGSLSSSLTTLTSAINNQVAVKAVQDTARSGLESMIGGLNINATGQFLFAGAQTDLTPMKDGSRKVVDAFNSFLSALSTKYSTTVTAATVKAEDLEKYFSVDGWSASPGSTKFKFDDDFDAIWSPHWSTGSTTPIVSRISKNETIESSLSTNDAAFRKLAAAYSLINSVGIETMGDQARATVAKAAVTRLSAGTDGVTALQAQVGTRLNRVQLADESLGSQMVLVQASIERLEGVDTLEAIQRITSLETQLQASYTVTGRLKGLSLMDYI
ncbi:flagellar hook-associated family protein [Aureimonas sp. SK2]|uniref:flagellar hook-associated family protein n=1 Tax=Aureimonas sp. SK2 TaxID=3015992 RepID=UPI0024446065|nr:flagellar hook-associated family protein [Aureimonas sp. SK2]